MAEKSLAEIPRAVRELYEKGHAALQQNNLDYAVAIFGQVLSKEPAFYDCREALRVSQFKKAGSGGGFLKKMWGTASNSPMVAKGQIALRNNPLEAVAIAEQILNGDPTNAGAHKLLAEAALAANLPRTAVLSLEIVLKNNPKDQDVALRLGEALTAAGFNAKAENIYKDLQRANPNDQTLAQALKNIAASRTMSEGGYEGLEDGSGSYRDILKNKSEAVQLEQEGRQVKSQDVAHSLIQDYASRLANDPNNLKLLRNIAELHAEKKEFDQALDYYERIKALQGGSDPALEQTIFQVGLRKFDHALSLLDPLVPEYEEQKKAVLLQKQDFQVASAIQRAERYPNDLQIRFELGVAYFQAGKTKDAIPAFQKAKENPHRRIQATAYLGQCFARQGMNDIAARTFQAAIKEKPSFDEEKKELIYNLGLVLEKMGKKDEAIEQFKQIYEADSAYRDVSAKVDAYYAGE
jgi:tetratricopeptide (TPR) repeat protein